MDLGAPTLAASSSPLTADHVHGPVEAGVVLAAFSRGFYVGLSGIASVLPVISSDAAALPTAVRLGKRSDEIDWGVRAGHIVAVGQGRIELPGAVIHAVREWRPATVRRPEPDGDGVHPRRRRKQPGGRGVARPTRNPDGQSAPMASTASCTSWPTRTPAAAAPGLMWVTTPKS